MDYLQKKTQSKDSVQELILSGKNIVFKKNDSYIFVEIRFNNNDIDGTRKWRVIFRGSEFHTSEILINIPSKTQSKFDEYLGGYKHHIVCEANEIVFKDNIANIW
jgi:hypothetical protein